MSTLKDAKAKPVKLRFNDGTEHEVLFTLNALALLEEKYDSVDAAFEALNKGSFRAIRYMLWAAIQHEEEPLTEAQVGARIDMNSLAQITEDLTKAMDNGMPTEEQLMALAASGGTAPTADPNM